MSNSLPIPPNVQKDKRNQSSFFRSWISWTDN